MIFYYLGGREESRPYSLNNGLVGAAFLPSEKTQIMRILITLSISRVGLIWLPTHSLPHQILGSQHRL